MSVSSHATVATDLFNLEQHLEHADLGCSLDGDEATRVSGRLYALEALVADADGLAEALAGVPLPPRALAALAGYSEHRRDLA